MAELQSYDGARVPLFDRLADRDPYHGEPTPWRTLDRTALHASVRREIARLLNTRAPLRRRELEARERSVIDYGIADFSAMSPQSVDDCDQLAMAIQQAIDAFEPRLQEVRVTIAPQPDFKALYVAIEAMLTIGSVIEPVVFHEVVRDERNPDAASEESAP